MWPSVFALIISALNFLSFLVFHFLEFLLDPDILFDIGIIDGVRGGGDGEALLLKIWQVSRDIVNIIFAFLLVIGALITVVTANANTIKPYIGKFVLAIILVNFSWFFPRVILDVSHVLTATIYQLPTLIGTECEVRKKADGPLEPCEGITDMKFFVTAKDVDDPANYTCPLGGDLKEETRILCYKVEKLENKTMAGGIINGLIINHARLPLLPRVINPGPGPGGDADDDKNTQIFTFIIHSVFVLILEIMLFFPLVAMLVVFLIRIPIIWLTIAFMPFMFIGFVVGDKMGGFDTMKLIFKKFLAAAFLPAVVAVPLSVGFIMINAGSASEPPPGIPELGEAQGLLLANISTPWGLLWLMLTFVVIWVGFFSVLQIDTIYQSIGNTIKGIGQNWGKFAAQIPLAIPMGIVPGGGTLLGAARSAMNPSRVLLSDSKINAEDLKRFGSGSSKDEDRIASYRNTLNHNNNINIKQDFDTNIRAVKDAADDVGKFNKLNVAYQAMKQTGKFNDMDKRGFLRLVPDDTGLTEDQKNAFLTGQNPNPDPNPPPNPPPNP